MIDWQDVISPLPGRVAVLVFEGLVGGGLGLGEPSPCPLPEREGVHAAGPSPCPLPEREGVHAGSSCPLPRAGGGSCGLLPCLVPEAVRRRAVEMGRPPYELLSGVVVAVGGSRGRVPMPPVGSVVWALPKPGLIVESGDLDLPSLGRLVPAGWTLRIYGVGERWDEQIVGFAG